MAEITKEERSSRVAQRWGVNTAKAGFTTIPTHLIAINKFMPKGKKLNPSEILVLLQILSMWWKDDRLPFPSGRLLGERTGLSERQVYRVIASLEDRGIIKRINRTGEKKEKRSNAYDVKETVSFVAGLVNQYPDAFKRRRGKKENPAPEVLDDLDDE